MVGFLVMPAAGDDECQLQQWRKVVFVKGLIFIPANRNNSIMIKLMRAILESDAGIIIAFILTAMELWALVKKARSYSKKEPGTTLVTVILTIGLILPILILISAPWKGIIYISLNIISVFILLSFFGLLFIMKEMSKVLVGRNIQEALAEAYDELEKEEAEKKKS
jgi:hypothetical protein